MTDAFIMGKCPINHPSCPCASHAAPVRNPVRSLSVLLDRVQSVKLSRSSKSGAISLHVEVQARNGDTVELDHRVDAHTVRTMRGDPLALVLGEVLDALQQDLT